MIQPKLVQPELAYMTIAIDHQMCNQQQVEKTYSNNLSREESIETIHPGNLFIKEPIQTNIGLTANHPSKNKPNNNFTKPKLVQQGDNNLLTRQPI